MASAEWSWSTISEDKATERKYTPEDLKTMQEWPLERKIQVSQTRILEFGLKLGGKIYVSFSGGKDSTVLLDLVRRVFPDTLAVFLDTGLEFPEIREFVKTVENVEWLKPDMNFRKVIEKYGYPIISKEVAQKIYEARRNPNSVVAKRFREDSEYTTKYGGRYQMAKWNWLKDSDIPISSLCCDVMKKRPAKKFERRTGLHPITGVMACESALRKSTWYKNGCNAFDSRRPKSAPLSFWTEQDILEYIKRFELRYASVYGEIIQDGFGRYYTTGRDRTGCVFCGFGIRTEHEPNRFQRLKQTHPQLWDYCMRPWDRGGLDMKRVLDYIHVKTE